MLVSKEDVHEAAEDEAAEQASGKLFMCSSLTPTLQTMIFLLLVGTGGFMEVSALDGFCVFGTVLGSTSGKEF